MELNRETVHAVEAPGGLTVTGPFHVYLQNHGGPVHVHLHLDDDLSRVARVDAVNHYVEEGETIRIPVGVAADRERVSGRLKIVSGYGAETAYVNVTVERRARMGPTATHGVTASTSEAGTDASATQSTTATERDDEPASQTDRGRAGDDPERAPVSSAAAGAPGNGAPSSDAGGDGPQTVVRRKRPSPSPSNSGRTAQSLAGEAARTLVGEGRALARAVDVGSERLAFGALAAVAVAVGIGVIAAVGEALFAFVVLVVVGAAVATAGWLLLT
ncbi:hypothetical protein DVK02_01130 [Halobellus sp. Atlit-31R]|nr:hypothetical protein DVK02_01130 [Halobellus sp. Atlit-31R]